MAPLVSFSRPSYLHPTKMRPSSVFFRTRDSRCAVGPHHVGKDVELTPLQNRELQIMRIVRHPNIVQLKAFFYNNGERVCLPSRGMHHDLF